MLPSFPPWTQPFLCVSKSQNIAVDVNPVLPRYYVNILNFFKLLLLQPYFNLVLFEFEKTTFFFFG